MKIDSYHNYLYDGSFYGLLTVVYEIYYSHSIPVDIRLISETSVSQSSFLATDKLIITDSQKAEKVYNAIFHKISSQSLDNVYYAFLSSIEGKELIIYNYIKLGFKIGNNLESHLYTEEVSALHKIVKKVTKEVMHMTGFIRFTFNNNFYYANYEPDHNITELLAPHFVDRFADQYFIIHDKLRNIALVYDTEQWVLTTFNKTELQNLTPDTKEIVPEDFICYEKLWQEYFVNIAIKERTNERQQKLYMPKRYWKNMLETKE
ncbi:MAG: TIGR03915 family putative DNA repair protein [Clostridiaceae bacterium]|nr:TIGR03915 family putative DNA repair protein [Clostridiaceae bacterium]